MSATILERNKFLGDKVKQITQSVDLAIGLGVTKETAINTLLAEKQKLRISLNGASEYPTDTESEEMREWFVAYAAVIEQMKQAA